MQTMWLYRITFLDYYKHLDKIQNISISHTNYCAIEMQQFICSKLSAVSISMSCYLQWRKKNKITPYWSTEKTRAVFNMFVCLILFLCLFKKEKDYKAHRKNVSTFRKKKMVLQVERGYFTSSVVFELPNSFRE